MLKTGLSLTLLAAFCIAATNPPSDPLDRLTPQSSVTAFLQACRRQGYASAAQYLDLRRLPAPARAADGPELARKLEALLNSDPRFNLFRLSRNPEGDLANPANPNLEPLASVNQDGRTFTVDLERVTLAPGGPQLWIFSADSLGSLGDFQTSASGSFVERHLPRFFTAPQFLETPLWKWLALLFLILVLLSLSRFLDWVLALVLRIPQRRLQQHSRIPWLLPVIQPLRVMFWLALFRVGIGIVNPSALARLYIGHGMGLVFVGSIAWCLIRLIGLLIGHVEGHLDPRQKMASGAMLRLGRRAANATVIVLAALLILQNWGYNTATLIAGLGVGGIAVALAAQQTIANVFGGISLIGDQPIRIGEFGKFGDIVGVVEDIGMRSTRVRTLNRSMVSVPNSNFAGLNLENYSVRDKILFNPTFQIKRAVTDDQMLALIDSIGSFLKSRADMQPAPTPARIVAISSAAYSLEIFAYVLTADTDRFYTTQSELLLRINGLFAAAHVELA
jgi:MscS family membrane protein